MSAAAAAVLSVPACADTSSDNTETVVVTGHQAAEAAALEKHTATIASEVIDAGTLTDVPVVSVVDGLKRLPGISVMNSYGNAEPRYITIRGMDSAFNVYTLNGVRLPSAEDSRAVALDQFSPDAITSVRIVKTVTPDLDGDALGGTVDLRTASPFDYADGYWKASGRIGYDQSTHKAPVELSGAYNTFLDGNKTLGLFATAYYSHRVTIAARNTNPDQSGSWQMPDGATGIVNPKSLSLVSHGLDQFTNNITRFGGDLMSEYRPADGQRFYLRASYELWSNPQRHDYLNVLKRYDDNNNENGFRTLIGAEIKKEDNRLASAGVGGSNSFGDITTSYDFAYSYGRVRTPQQYYMEFNSDSATDPAFNSNISFDTSDARHPRWVLSNAQASAMYNIGNLGLSDAELYNRIAEDRQMFARSDTSWTPSDLGILREVKAGFRIRNSARRYDQHQIADILTDTPYQFADVPPGTKLSTLPSLLGGTIDNYQGFYHGNTRFGTILNMDEALKMLEAAPQVTDDVYPWNLNRRRGRETSYSGYAMAVLGTETLSTTVGARYEFTSIRNEYLVTTSNDDGTVTRIFGGPNGTSTSSYGNFLPSIHVNWRPDESWSLRGAVWTSFARPNFLDISGASTENRVGGQVVSISRGNPDLKPANAVNFDLGVDYLAGDTSFTLNGFFKSINDFMYLRASSASSTVGTVTISQPMNGKTATIWGVEFGGQQPLFAGVSLIANLTLENSSADPGSDFGYKVRLPNSPNLTYNIGFSYEAGPWGADLNYNYQGLRLTVLRGNGLDEWDQPIKSMDAAIHYHPLEVMTISLEGRNLTGEAGYWGTRGKQQIATVDYLTAARSVFLSLSIHQ